MRVGARRLAATCTVALQCATGAYAAEPAAAAPPLLEQPLEDLLAVEVTTLGRRVQAVHDVAGAVTVVAGDDLQRGGARSVLEVLAQVPGVSVERYNGRLTSVAVRGDGSSRYARNVLVLLDGRSQYSALFGGVEWELLDLPLAVIERIEVLRGAGSALWGGHAVNSVINIVTRHAEGLAASVLTDSTGRRTGSFRWAAPEAASEGWTPSLWASVGRQPGSQTLLGRDDWDDENSLALGATVRHATAGGAELRIDADHRQSDGGHDLATSMQPGTPGQPGVPGASRERYLVSTSQADVRWSQVESSGNSLALSGSLQSTRSQLTGNYDLQSDLLDLEGQRLWRLGGHELQIGGGATWTVQRELEGGSRPPPRRLTRTLRAYVQDEWLVNDGNTALTGAAQVEYRSDTGSTLSPALRVRHTVSPQLTLWAAAALSSNEPIENDLSGGGGPRRPPPDGAPAMPPPGGGPSGGPPPGGQPPPGGGSMGGPPPSAAQRRVPSLDVGLHWQPAPAWRWNAALYWQHYRDGMFPAAGGGPQENTPVTVTGTEIDLRWQPAPDWDLSTALSLVHARVAERDAGPFTTNESAYLGAVPRRRLTLQATYRVDEKRHVDVAFNARSALSAAQVPGMGRLDLAYRQRLGQQFEWGVALRQANHRELPLYGPSEAGVLRFESERSVRAWLSWMQR